MHHPQNFNLTRHFVRFLLPFSILDEGKSWSPPGKFNKTFKTILTNLEKSPVWQVQPHRQMQYILPYVDDFFTNGLHEGKSTGSAFVFSMPNDQIQKIFGQRDTRVLLSRSFKKDKNNLKMVREWLLFPIYKLQPRIYLFTTGIGLLLIEIEIDQERPVLVFSQDKEIIPRTEKLDVEHLIIFNQQVRKMLFENELKRDLKTAFLLPEKIATRNIYEITPRPFKIKEELHHSIHQHINASLKGGKEHLSREKPDKKYPAEKRVRPLPINALVEFFLKPVGAPQKNWDALYEYRMMGYSYIQIRKENEKHEPIEVPYQEIARPLFWLRQYLVPEYLPSEKDLSLEGNPYIYRSYQNIYFGFSLEGGVTMVWESESLFIKETFINRIRNEYFTLFLLALHQQMLSHRINKQINEIGNYSKRRKYKMIKNLRDQIFEFVLKNWFPQVSNNLVYNEVYNRWRKVMHVEPLFAEIKREIDELDDYLERNQQQKENQLLNFITWFFFPFVFLVGFWGMNIEEIIQPVLSFQSIDFLYISGSIVIGYYVLLMLVKLFRNK
ncbi:hypothetical protein ACX8XP_04555 [Calditrichota bacterium LG25]